MFKIIKEIVSKEGVLHFKRWNIFSSKFFCIYFHGIYKADEDLHLHNHPWNIATIILRGSYLEELHSNKIVNRHWLHFGYRSRKSFHKIQKLLSNKVYSLAFVFGERSEWGYNVDGKEVQHEEYRYIKNLTEYQRKFLQELRNNFKDDQISIGRGSRILVNGEILKGILFPVNSDRDQKLHEINLQFTIQEINIQFKQNKNNEKSN